MKEARGILAVSGGYIAAVIGAGFASGQEILSFFVAFGRYGMIGIIIACAVFSLFSYAVTGFCAQKQIYSFSEILDFVFKGKYTRVAAGAMVFICAGASICVMTACAGEIGALTGAQPVVGAAVFVLVCGFIFALGARRVMDINSVMGAVVAAGIIFACFYILRFREHQTFLPHYLAAISGFSYAGYNIVGTGALLAAMSKQLKDKKEAAISSVASGAALFVMITLIWGVLSIYYGKIDLGEIPMLTMSLRQNKALGIFYAVMLAAAALSTGISNGFALIDTLGKKLSYGKKVFLILVVSFAASGAGFAWLIETVYSACGYIGAAVAAVIMYKCISEMKNAEKRSKKTKIKEKYLK